MKFLFIADVVGKPGRRILANALRKLKEEEEVSLVIANGENGAGGYGLTSETADELFSIGIDLLTSGNHIWDKKEFIPRLRDDGRILRPANYPPGNPGRGSALLETLDGREVGVLNLQGKVFMPSLDCPFRTGIQMVEEMRQSTRIIVVDFHAEATAEKVALGWYLDGLVSAVIGTHTHIQTADERVLPGGTAYITDIGMTGSIDSVIGVKTELALKRFLTQVPHRFQTAERNVRLMGVVCEVDDHSGKAKWIKRINIGETQGAGESEDDS
ncbi:MAG: TIGR00282 family metallophosphoesterase [Candidatus Glassbacteria bacterium]